MSTESPTDPHAPLMATDAPAAVSEATPGPRRSRLRTWAAPALLALVALAAFYAGRSIGGFHRLPEIAATLPGDESEFNRELDLTMQQRFPLGSSEKQLIDELSRQGFTPEWRERDYANAASFTWSGLLCTKIVRVIWRADDQGALTQIDGSYETKCAF